VLDLNRLGPVLPRVRMSPAGLLLRPWFRRSRLVPWTKINDIRIAPADRWSGHAAVPGSHGRYMVQVRLAGDWRRVGHVLRVRHSVLPTAVRQELFGAAGAWTTQESTLFSAYRQMRALWENAGGKRGDEDDNWPGPAVGRLLRSKIGSSFGGADVRGAAFRA
jgi:hypothetical protein